MGYFINRLIASRKLYKISMEAPENIADLLKQFRDSLSDILTQDYTDAVLLKWLRARNYNLKKAEHNFREVDSNKTIFGVKTILETYVKPEVAAKYERTCLIGIAKDGTPIRYISFGLDYRGFIMSLTGYEQCLYFSHCMELDIATGKKENEKTGRDVNEVTYIFDMEEFSLQDCMNKCVMESGMDFFRLLQDHYPEVWKHVFIVNAPGYFYRAFNLLTPIFRPTLLEKIQVVPKNQTKELLRKYIDDDVLPAFLGGQKVDSKGDPKCSELFPIMEHPYCKIPEEFYVNNRLPLLPLEEPGVQSATVGARSVYNVAMKVDRAGAKIHFRYRSEGGSLGIRILFREDEKGDIPGKNEQIVPYEGHPRYRVVSATLRQQSHLAENSGVGMLQCPGLYILQFDNSHSWFMSRKLIYRIKEVSDES